MEKNYLAHVANKAIPPRARLTFEAKDVVYVHVCSALFNRYIHMRLSFVLMFVIYTLIIISSLTALCIAHAR